jgi:hypothetical protein
MHDRHPVFDLFFAFGAPVSSTIRLGRNSCGDARRQHSTFFSRDLRSSPRPMSDGG